MDDLGLINIVLLLDGGNKQRDLRLSETEEVNPISQYTHTNIVYHIH